MIKNCFLPFYLISLVVISCGSSADKRKKENEIVNEITKEETDTVFATKTAVKDRIISSDSVEISGEKYFAYYTSNDIFFILNQFDDTVFMDNDLSPMFEFEDFNKDGFMDIIFCYNSNVPGIYDLLLFDNTKKTFKKVENFQEFPAPIKIGKTKYYYSYHRSGCADMNWDSDLFYIDNFKAIRIGNISGIGCENEPNGIYIHKIKGEKEIPFKTLPIETICKYKDYKWGFIKEYWTKNYIYFVK